MFTCQSIAIYGNEFNIFYLWSRITLNTSSLKTFKYFNSTFDAYFTIYTVILRY